jgi:signal transduction histidine kinase
MASAALRSLAFRQRLAKIPMRSLLRIATMTIAGLLCVAPVAAEQLPQTVLVLDQSTPYTEYFGKLFASFQSTLKADSDIPITIDLERMGQNPKGAEYNVLLHTFMKQKYQSRPVGVIVANGVDALQFAVGLRSDLDPRIPIVFSGVDESTAAQSSLPSNTTGTIIRRTIRQVLITAKTLVPGFKRIAIVGDPLEQQTYRRHYTKELLAIGNDVEFIDLTGLPMNQLRERVATLPQDAVIFYTTLSFGGGSARYDPNDALALVAEVANRPIVIDLETRLGYGGTGGFVLQAAPVGEAAARIVLRLLNGESASSIPVTVGEFVKPIFDWRGLKRWNVPESSLPAGSEIRFRQASAWEQYRLQITGVCAALLLQAALIGWLIYEIGRRQRAEMRSRSAMAELAYMDRREAAGQLSASITHEVNQPLTGIVTKANAALRWLRADKPNLERAEAALEGIVAAGHRASGIITGVRAMFKKAAPEKVPTDINQIILTVLSMLRGELQKHGVTLHTQLSEHLPTVQGDTVQLQQVVLNLIMNAIEAMHSVRPRVLEVKADATKSGMVHVSIEDTGTGIDPSHFDRIFKSLFTTKPNGMGMGLFICHSIIENHGGRIWVSPAATRGSIFQFELPISSAQGAGQCYGSFGSSSEELKVNPIRPLFGAVDQRLK